MKKAVTVLPYSDSPKRDGPNGTIYGNFYAANQEIIELLADFNIVGKTNLVKLAQKRASWNFSGVKKQKLGFLLI